MYAIVEIAGHQYKVTKDQRVFVNRLREDEGAKVQFDDVLLIDDSGKITVGAPAIKGAAVKAKVEKHLKGDKVIVFKKKRRKGYKKKNGFRAYLTELVIEGIQASGATAKKAAPKADTSAPIVEQKEKKAPAKKASAKKAPAKKAAPKADVSAPIIEKKEKKAPAKKASAKKAPAKKADASTKVDKPAAKKSPAKKAAPKASGKGDDLTKVEGIGPKIAEVFNNAGIGSFAELAAKSVDELKGILAEAGSRFKSKNPGSWPKQAKMAADGKWDELKEWQDNHKGGIEA